MSFFQFLLFIIFFNLIINREEDYEKNTKLGNFYELNDYIFGDLVSHNSSNNSWFIIFYDRKCPYSRGALINLKRDLLIHYESNKTLKFGIIDIENINCRNLTRRFKVKRVPYTVFIQKDRMYPYTEIFTPGRIIDFIKKINISNYQLVPKDPYEQFYLNIDKSPISFYEQSKINFFEYITSLNKPMQDFLDKYSINIKWSNKMTYISFILFIILLFPIEYYIIKFILLCLGYKINQQVEINSNNNNNKKNVLKDKENKKELKLNNNKKENTNNKEKIE